jgi:hypothetical protein
VIEVEQPAEVFRLYHWPFLQKQASVGKRNNILNPLMIVFAVVSQSPHLCIKPRLRVYPKSLI